MIHVQKILYATDFSPYSNQAYFHAVGLAEVYGATLTIVHVCPPAAGESIEERNHSRSQLEQIRPVNRDIPIEHVVLEGDPAEEIIHLAKESRTDLIVVGTHGRAGLERLLLGSVAENVLRGAPCSVLVVKMSRAMPTS